MARKTTPKKNERVITRKMLDEVVDALTIVEEGVRFIEDKLEGNEIHKEYHGYGGPDKWTDTALIAISSQRQRVMRMIGEFESGDPLGLFDRIMKAKCDGKS